MIDGPVGTPENGRYCIFLHNFSFNFQLIIWQKLHRSCIGPHLLIYENSLEVVAAPLPEVEFNLPVEAENLADVRHLPQPGHHLQDALGSPVFLE